MPAVFIKNTIRRTVFTLIAVTIALAVIIPVAYFVSISFASNYEAYQFPARIFPSLSYNAKFIYNASDDNFSLHIEKNGIYESVKTDSDSKSFRTYLLNQLNVNMEEEHIRNLMSEAKTSNEIDLKLKKDIFRNYKIFFILADGSIAALVNSLQAAAWTIVISLLLGGTAGYTLARMNFRFKETLNLSLLVVRMFPVVAISLPMVIYIMKMNVYDTPFSLALVYSVPTYRLDYKLDLQRYQR